MKCSRKEIQSVLRAQSGDTDALDTLFLAVQEPVHRYIVSLVKDEHLAYDVLQEVFLLVVRKIYWLKEARAFRPWVYRIASREAFHHLRSERRLPDRLQDPSLLESVEEESELPFPDREMVESLQEILNQVSPASRAVLSLHYLHGMSLRETADILEISVGTAKSRLAYGLSTLREKLDENHQNGRPNLG